MTAAAALPDRSSARRLRQGIVLAFGCAFSSSTMPSLAHLAYDGGADPMTVTLSRCLSAVMLYAMLCRLRRAPLLPPHGMRLPAALAGLVWLVAIYCYVRSIQHIPVGIAVGLFFLFPLIVALIARVVDGEMLSRARLLALCLGCAGVSLAVGVSPGRIDPVGVGLAVTAALGMSINIVISVRLLRHSRPLTVMASMIGTATLALLLVAALVGVPWPSTGLGWFGLIAGAATFCLCNTLFYLAISLIGSVRTAMVCNIEPVVATLFAFMILGEALGALQLVGVALVVGALMLMQAGERAGRP
jgi:drug/metabolite transporter (DMT)-like permease